MSTTALTIASHDRVSPLWRDGVLAILVAGLCYWLSCSIIAPGDVAKGFGVDWQQMSTAPLDLLGRFPQRILAPWLANFMGLGGEHFLVFVRGLSLLLLGTVFFFCRRRGAAVVDASLITVAIAVTAAIQLYKDHWVGYADALCYALCFWMLLASKRAVIFWGLFLLNLFNHELVVFLLPWLWFVRRQANGSWRTDAVGTALTLGLYGAFYLWVKANAPAQQFNAQYFAQHPLFPGGTFVVLLLAMTHLVVAFGPVLAVLAWHQHTRSHGRERLHLWLVMGGVAVIFCIAFDWARHSNLVVLPLTLASLRFLGAGHRVAYTFLVALGAGLMLCISPWAPTAWPTNEMADLQVLVLHGVVVIEGQDYFTGPLSAAVTRWLPAVAPMLSILAAILAAIWLAGALFARFRPAAVPPAPRVTG